ncbi:Asp-tRNA(Asn)/Glu-tRNA(Gln) amidotransferase subunit GatB [Stecheria sp. CLA-KB-P133]|uniref:Aspartyl/glutamyl-tRNA(Asn/Gln) amidotransferase subunit B n=1 Tax=Grylomicrobium aquisgranensis TaxID=2926318 RepID=A0AB35U5G0_9FIRM|nr:Asp-tRNA(Asn)/Glu-tRNA(Gln) amidotransferase subunit GatB [Lactimicrobium massiliense]MDX8420393.1 Asp-tRNA(Asn)/Glu-tRNA(Gln) amidotransferase subunit GatB [Stecheria sp. CLA-KB-P133]MDY3931635.1 Asp-tRNA(Asn)/Glu-tRNA(Gln) amidotransferase subunit GatB [Erysipelotrichaceae bacterium]MDD6229920.1 Asp-tRNA(Asn)/Glu-tRNA(Gln) amidotransferase subunit GatB [Lactimicrobium massiliense]MDD6457673.1 Asp-tRNA(Asn)/Glu-tRNA(Gln) amidotransferase subunit GatB [Lactimicrobium massiliense]MDD6560014.
MEYNVTIGIEIHCQLKTDTKMFSGAPTSFGRKANTCVNEIDLGMPGTLPEVNKEAVKKAIMACTAFHMTIDPLVKFDRKNYYYSDLAKGFQITQQFHPIGRNGYVVINTPQGEKKIRIERIHMEEDTAKQYHLSKVSLLDFNRADTPLIEIVSKPDMTNGQEAEAYVEALRQTLYYIGVSDCKMEEGSMRCDVNVSIAPKGADHLGTKNEIKNINSISNIGKAVDYEVERQKKLLEAGDVVHQETRRFDDKTGTTILMRRKEGNVDYKFFPEPNIFPIRLDPKWIADIQAHMPELPEARRARYQKEYGLSDHDIDILIANKEMSEFFEETMKYARNAKAVCNWLLSDISAWLNKHEKTIDNCDLKPQNLAKLVSLIDAGEVSNAQAKKLVDDLMAGKDPQKSAEEKGLRQVSDTGAIEKMVTEVLDANPQAIEDFKNGKDRAVGFLVGQVMKKSRGQANPGMVNKMVRDALKSRI